MSHIVQIQTEVRDPLAILAACHRLKVPTPTLGTHRLFQTTAEGWGVSLSGWRYPVVCQLESGRIQFDNYGGNWGEQAQLDRFLQLYATEKAKLEARSKGYSVFEQSLEDGSIKLTINIGDAA
jgi:hypothetical protein